MKSYHCHFWYVDNNEKEYGYIDADSLGEAVEKCYDLFEKEPSLEEVDFWNDAAGDLFMECHRTRGIIRFDNVEEFWLEDD